MDLNEWERAEQERKANKARKLAQKVAEREAKKQEVVTAFLAAAKPVKFTSKSEPDYPGLRVRFAARWRREKAEREARYIIRRIMNGCEMPFGD